MSENAGATADADRPVVPDKTSSQPPAQPDPEILKKILGLRTLVRESFGQVVMALMNLPRYRHQPLGDLGQLVLEPLIRDRIAIACCRRRAKAGR